MVVLLGIVLGLILQGAMIWSAVLAKPLGNKPYRWGKYIGLHHAFVAVVFWFMNYNTDLRLAGVIVSCCAGFLARGILRRQKYGVVMFGVTQLLLVLTDLHLVVWTEPISILFGPVLPAALGIVSAAYFHRRWSLLGRGNQRPVAAAAS